MSALLPIDCCAREANSGLLDCVPRATREELARPPPLSLSHSLTRPQRGGAILWRTPFTGFMARWTFPVPEVGAPRAQKLPPPPSLHLPLLPRPCPLLKRNVISLYRSVPLTHDPSPLPLSATDQNIALHVLPTARNFTFRISAYPVHSTFTKKKKYRRGTVTTQHKD